MAKVINLKDLYNADSLEMQVKDHIESMEEPLIRYVGCERSLIRIIQKHGSDRYLPFDKALKDKNLRFEVQDAIDYYLGRETEEKTKKIVAAQFSPEYVMVSTFKVPERNCFEECMSNAAKEESGVVLVYDGRLMEPVDLSEKDAESVNLYYFKAKKGHSLKEALVKILWFDFNAQ